MTHQIKMDGQPVSVTNLNLRRELHGDDEIPACDITVKMVAHNDALSILDDSLVDALYTDEMPNADPKIKQLAGMEKKAHLRISKLAKPIELKIELVGARVEIPWGRNHTLVFADAKAKKFKVLPLEGGSCEITFQIQTIFDIADGEKLLTIWYGGEIELTMEAAQKELGLDDPDGESEQEAATA